MYGIDPFWHAASPALRIAVWLAGRIPSISNVRVRDIRKGARIWKAVDLIDKGIELPSCKETD